VAYYEEKIHRTYLGGHGGLSFRVAKGITLHTGSYQGRRIETAELVLLAAGLLGITSKHIYFAGRTKAFRTPYAKIVAFTPYTDGLGICQDGANAKPQLFRTPSGLDLYNLVTMLAQA
jgi:hypothetical protein